MFIDYALLINDVVTPPTNDAIIGIIADKNPPFCLCRYFLRFPSLLIFKRWRIFLWWSFKRFRCVGVICKLPITILYKISITSWVTYAGNFCKSKPLSLFPFGDFARIRRNGSDLSIDLGMLLFDIWPMFHLLLLLCLLFIDSTTIFLIKNVGFHP